MREILFRGKKLGSGEWMEGNNLTSAYYPNRAWITKGNAFFDRKLDSIAFDEIDTDTVGQYTGLTDKNGVKIFEGDIVDHHVQGDILVSRGVVEWDERNGGWGLRLRTMFPSFSWYNPAAYEVIGNIHDNPELLKGGDTV